MSCRSNEYWLLSSFIWNLQNFRPIRVHQKNSSKPACTNTYKQINIIISTYCMTLKNQKMNPKIHGEAMNIDY